ncbi:hypothetical protein CNY89_04670 [Amaricoccus sp. HAR-UPW-R2A-40]|nr:hypothetical protein CNY89_04670 [Amaricoccus sp. HAR-UPW-R2A-40]
MGSRNKDGGGVLAGDDPLTIAAYTTQDVGWFLQAALAVTHASEAREPLCCVAAAGLLLTAAEMILRGPISRVIGEANESALRQQAAATADLLNHLNGSKKGVRH